MVKVSVIIPVYNSEKYLKQCIDSVLNQSLKEIELICVDDGSTDNSLNILNEYKNNDERVVVLTQKNQYAGVARNNGMKVAKGEYLIFVDADDFFEKDMFLSMYNKCKEDSADMCLCNARSYDDKTSEYAYPTRCFVKDYFKCETPFKSDDVKENIFKMVTPAPWNKMIKKDFIEENNLQFQSLKRSNDIYFGYLSLALCKKITYVDERFVNYRVNNDSSLQGSKKELSLDFITALLQLKKDLQKNNIFKDFEKSFVNRALSTCLYNLEKIEDKDDFIKLANQLKEDKFYKLSILGHSRGYFDYKNQYDVLLKLMAKTGEELWNEKNEKKNDEVVLPLIDIEKWENNYNIDSNESIKVSVIVPCYNVEKYLNECLDSILNNTLKDIEVVCVNDGSTDNTKNIIEEYAQKDERIKVINKENDGVSSARNDGLRIAKGEYILFVDSDDMIELKTLEYLYSVAKQDNLDIHYFSAKSFFDSDELKKSNQKFESYYDRKNEYNGVMTGKEYFIKVSNNAEFKPAVWMQLIKRELIDKNQIRFIEKIIYEDNPFSIECMYFANRVEYSNINLYKRRIRNDSIMTLSKGINSAFAYFVSMSKVKEFAKRVNAKKDKEFYIALLNQLKRMDAGACNFISDDITDEEIDEFILTKDENIGIDFYFYVKSSLDYRRKLKDKSNEVRNLKEKSLMDGYFRASKDKDEKEKQALKDEKHKNEILRINEKHKDEVLKLNEKYKKLKAEKEEFESKTILGMAKKAKKKLTK